MITIRLFATLLSYTALLATPAVAVDGEVLITHAKALNGNITPGDTAGYPITISRPGVYKLASNLPVPLDKDGIEVIAADVTIDLAGFRMHGQGKGRFGIAGGQASLTVRNGTIAGFKADGIFSTNTNIGHSWIVENRRLTGNNRGAFPGNLARVVNSTVTGNQLTGVACQVSCHIQGNLVSNNGNDGVTIISGTVLDNTVALNVRTGIFATGVMGFGNNTLFGNGDNVASAGAVIPLHPNACSPAC